jgi:hypothetical protein
MELGKVIARAIECFDGPMIFVTNQLPFELSNSHEFEFAKFKDSNNSASPGGLSLLRLFGLKQFGKKFNRAQELIEEVSADELKAEMELVSDKFNIRAAWVAVVFVPIFAITDYLNLPHGWFTIFIIRCSISIGMTIMLAQPK